MCFVFLKATGSKAIATADLESHHIIEGPGCRRCRSSRSWRIHRVSFSASIPYSQGRRRPLGGVKSCFATSRIGCDCVHVTCSLTLRVRGSGTVGFSFFKEVLVRPHTFAHTKIKPLSRPGTTGSPPTPIGRSPPRPPTTRAAHVSREHRRGRPLAALGGQQLVAHEGGVERVGVGGQLLVRAALDGCALVQYDDLVGAHLVMG
jgi:hypothetical protein